MDSELDVGSDDAAYENPRRPVVDRTITGPSPKAGEEVEEWYGIAPQERSDWTPWAGVAEPEHSPEDAESREDDVDVDGEDKRDGDCVPSASPPARRRTRGRRHRV